MPEFQLNRVLVIQEGEPLPKFAPPVITILSPPPGFVARLKTPFDCELRVEVPEGGRMPETVEVSLVRGNAPLMGAGPAVPTGRTSHATTLKVRVDPPPKPGDCEILAIALNTIVVEPKAPGAKPIDHYTRTPSRRVKIHVKAR